MSKYFAIDIETVPWFKNEQHKETYIEAYRNKTYKTPATVESNKKEVLNKAALRPISGEIIVIGVATEEQTVTMVNRNPLLEKVEDPMGLIMQFDNERDMINNFYKLMEDAIDNGALVLSFNGKEFDFPFIFVRALYNKCTASRIPHDDLIHKYRHNPHLDLKSFFDKGGLNEIAYILELGELSEPGGNLPKLWEENPLEVIKKNSEDLSKTLKLGDILCPWIKNRPMY